MGKKFSPKTVKAAGDNQAQADDIYDDTQDNQNYDDTEVICVYDDTAAGDNYADTAQNQQVYDDTGGDGDGETYEDVSGAVYMAFPHIAVTYVGKLLSFCTYREVHASNSSFNRMLWKVLTKLQGWPRSRSGVYVFCRCRNFK